MAYLKNSEESRNQVKELTDQLEQGVREIFESEKYAEYLRVMSKFSHYSVKNTILIAIQRPDASMVAGYKAWQTNFGRYVNRGEQGIRILAPMTYRTKREKEKIDPVTNQPMRDEYGKIIKEEMEVTIPSFKVSYVFDVNQTSGKPLPSLIIDLEGDVNGYHDFLSAVRKVSPVPISFEGMDGKDGYYHQVEQRIVINEDLSERQAMAAIIHELSHAKLHALDPENLKESAKARGKDQRTMEVEAESVSYVVNSHFGIDTSANSWGYVASWSKNKELPELHASLQVIKDTAADMIDNIEAELAEIRNVYVEKEEALEALDQEVIVFDVLEREQVKTEQTSREEVVSINISARQIADELIKIGEEFDLYDFKDRVDDPEYLQAEIEYNLQAGKGMEYAPFLNDVIDDGSPELVVRAENLLSKIREYIPEPVKDMEPIVKVKYSEYLKFPAGRYGSIKDMDTLVAELDQEIIDQKMGLSEGSSAADKTYLVRVSILYVREEKVMCLEGRFDLGNGNGGLIDNLKANVAEQFNSESRKQYLQSIGDEFYQKEMEELHNQQENILPYLQQFCSLQERTPEVKTTMKTIGQNDRQEINRITHSEKKFVPQKVEKRSIHERLKENKEKLARTQGKGNLREGVELA